VELELNKDYICKNTASKYYNKIIRLMEYRAITNEYIIKIGGALLRVHAVGPTIRGLESYEPKPIQPSAEWEDLFKKI